MAVQVKANNTIIIVDVYFYKGYNWFELF